MSKMLVTNEAPSSIKKAAFELVSDFYTFMNISDFKLSQIAIVLLSNELLDNEKFHATHRLTELGFKYYVNEAYTGVIYINPSTDLSGDNLLEGILT